MQSYDWADADQIVLSAFISLFTGNNYKKKFKAHIFILFTAPSQTVKDRHS